MLDITITSDMCADEKILKSYLTLALPDADELEVLYLSEQITMHRDHANSTEFYTKFRNTVVRCRILDRNRIVPNEKEATSILTRIRRWLYETMTYDNKS